MNPIAPDPSPPAGAGTAASMPPLVAADLQDHLMTATNDLDRLQRLLSGTCDSLLACFHGTLGRLDALAAPGLPPAASQAAQDARRQLAEAVVALQFQDMASQLITHTHQRLRNCADQIARDAFGPDPEGEAVVAAAPLRPNPVTQDEMDAGSVELF
jgi:hypothetical protein